MFFPIANVEPLFPAVALPSPTPSIPEAVSVAVADLIDPPGRFTRPPRLVIILRGVPGAGKTRVAQMIKAKELECGSAAPRMQCLDDYFECDGEYEYEPEMADSYRQSLVKTFKKNVDDGFFNFIIVDCVNDKTSHYQDMWSHAKQRGFEARK